MSFMQAREDIKLEVTLVNKELDLSSHKIDMGV